MPKHKLIECSDTYSNISGILWQYCRDELVIAANAITDFNAANAITDSFKTKDKITGQTGDSGRQDVEIMVSLKYVISFWRTLEIPLINCEINLKNTLQ